MCEWTKKFLRILRRDITEHEPEQRFRLFDTFLAPVKQFGLQERYLTELLVADDHTFRDALTDRFKARPSQLGRRVLGDRVGNRHPEFFKRVQSLR
jgi:hypothetical protein